MRIATRVAVFFMTSVSCGLNTGGVGDEEDFAPDVLSDETLPDVSEADITAEEEDSLDVWDESGPDDAEEPDEPTDTPPDVAEEEFTEVDSGETGDETVDPCAPPDIPTTGIWLFFCLTTDTRTDMTMWRWVDRDELPDIEWNQEISCTVRNARKLFCDLSLYEGWRPATVHFNIAMRGSLWSCEGFDTPYGQPRIWIDGGEITLGMAPGAPPGSSNHTFRLPPL